MGTTQTLTVPSPETLARFESAYSQAESTGDMAAIPWEDGQPNPHLVEWLNRDAPAVLRCGSRVAVVGCGLGHDARELIQRGYEVTAFDISPTAIAWARRLDPDHASNYLEANVLEAPARWVHRFDLVVEVYTIQSVPPECRGAMFEGIGRLVGMRGHLLVICRATDRAATPDDGPPWPLTAEELRELAAASGFRCDEIESMPDRATPTLTRLRALFRRD